ncbi:hypothetical protein [Ostreiculturibacter nitratireducens]|uniref:hypothetical protein n=1 Tax=Ostreiculturibacter nitratireducens TaxID=3075226 RepID=UPI0031B59009
MADANGSFGADDVRAAVQGGILTEAQAASLLALAQSRAGTRGAMGPEDEPFEFFRGFSEIFVSVGLLILLSGVAGLVSVVGGLGAVMLIPLVMAGVAWWWAGYFTLRRRMNLPSMVLASAFGLGIFSSAFAILGDADSPARSALVGACLLAGGAMAAWYRRFRLPFAMFVLGLFGLGAIYAMTASLEAIRGFGGGFHGGIFDLRNSPQFSLATLVFGLLAFLGGMWFDTRDPHRLGRYAATGFWLHLLAAPALVNTVALTLYNIGGSTGMLATAAALTAIAVLALAIDRRSFLTAGIVYMALLIAWAVRGDGAASFGQWVAILLILGAFITALGTWWVPLRAGLMRALPDFPGKSRLPPYTEAK